MTFLVAALLLAVAARPVVGQYGFGGEPPTEPPTVEELAARYAKIDESALQSPPERDYKVVMGPAEKVKLFRADPKLLENKFAATLTLVPGGVDLATLQPAPDSGTDPFGNPNEVHSVRPSFVGLARQCPPEQRPDEQLVEFLTSADVDRDVKYHIRQFQKTNDATFEGTVSTWGYTIYAPTAEEAEKRAAAIVRLSDCGVLAGQRFQLATGKLALEAAQSKQAELTKIAEELETLEAKIAKPSDISGDILSELKAQKIMVAVELAGLAARVKACDDMLKGSRELPVSTIQSVSDMKIKAEIERIGIKEKLDQINRFVEEGDSRAAMQDRLQELLGTRKQRDGALLARRREAANSLITLENFALYQLQDNQLKIVPVEWTN